MELLIKPDVYTKALETIFSKEALKFLRKPPTYNIYGKSLRNKIESTNP